MSCSQIVDIEDLVLGTIDDGLAADLRMHLRTCDECRAEAELVSAERALFEDREAVLSGPPPALADAIRAEVAIVSSPFVARASAQVVQLFRRGHFSAACAAGLFVVAAMSRLGNGGLAGSTAVSGSVMGENEASGILATMSIDEPLACSPRRSTARGAAPMSWSDETLSSPAFHASLSEAQVLACTPAGSRAACESSSSVTCATLRQ